MRMCVQVGRLVLMAEVAFAGGCAGSGEELWVISAAALAEKTHLSKKNEGHTDRFKRVRNAAGRSVAVGCRMARDWCKMDANEAEYANAEGARRSVRDLLPDTARNGRERKRLRLGADERVRLWGRDLCWSCKATRNRQTRQRVVIRLPCGTATTRTSSAARWWSSIKGAWWGTGHLSTLGMRLLKANGAISIFEFPADRSGARAAHARRARKRARRTRNAMSFAFLAYQGR